MSFQIEKLLQMFLMASEGSLDVTVVTILMLIVRSDAIHQCLT